MSRTAHFRSFSLTVYTRLVYTVFMIRSFADRETEKVYNQTFSRKLPQSIQSVALRKLIMIDNAGCLEDLRVPPANRLEKLDGNRKGENVMSNRIPTPTMGEILMEEFMIPMNLTAYKLAHSIHVPTSRIQDILHNRRKITADTSIRLGRFFGVSDRYFLDMQNDIEIRELIEKLDGDITTIKPYAAAAM